MTAISGLVLLRFESRFFNSSIELQGGRQVPRKHCRVGRPQETPLELELMSIWGKDGGRACVCIFTASFMCVCVCVCLGVCVCVCVCVPVSGFDSHA